jgi:hypothetical protein
MTLLRVYVSVACASYVTAYERVAHVQRLRPDHPVEVLDLDQAGAEHPSVVFATPTYCLDAG